MLLKSVFLIFLLLMVVSLNGQRQWKTTNSGRHGSLMVFARPEVNWLETTPRLVEYRSPPTTLHACVVEVANGSPGRVPVNYGNN